MLFRSCVKQTYELIYFAFGFILYTSFGVSVISILVVSLVFALIDFRYSGLLSKKEA